MLGATPSTSMEDTLATLRAAMKRVEQDVVLKVTDVGSLGQDELQALLVRLRAACSAMRDVEQDIALAAASEAGLRSSHCLALLRQVSMQDAEAYEDLSNIVAELTSHLSGSGVHTSVFATGSVSLRLRSRPRGTGTGTRMWRAARLAAWACETRWGLDVCGRRIIELGCGTAVVGLACAALGCSEV
eukprot:3364104-Prymnesium_polylepis.1